MTLRKFLALFAMWAICAGLISSDAYGESVRSKWSIAVDGGARQAIFNRECQPWALSAAYGAELHREFGDVVSLGLTASYSELYNDTLSTSTFKIGRDHADASWKSYCCGVASRFRLNTDGAFAPFLKLGGGLSFWEIIDLETNRRQIVRSADGMRATFSATELYVMSGLGAEVFLNSRWCIEGGVELYYLTGQGTDFDEETSDGRSRGFADARIGIGFYFGPRKKALSQELQGDETVDDTVVVPSSVLSGDADSDGVSDDVDRCPETPPEAIAFVDETGCAVDGDGDGTPDYLDKCLDTPPGMPTDSVGCALDADLDGVPDGHDECPDTPGNYDVDAQGCIDMAELLRRRVLHFDYPSGGSDVGLRAAVYLDSLVQLLNDFPEVKIAIYGYTDNIGSEEANLRLSQKRADKVKGYLVSRGIAPSRIEAVGKGETDFVESNISKYGREKNRRIEIQFTY